MTVRSGPATIHRRARAATPAFPLLSETLLVGMLVAVASIPVVTALPAMAAAVRHLRRHVAGERDAVRLLLADMLLACRRLWPVAAAAPAMVLLLAFNVWFASTATLPGGPAVAVVSAGLALGVVVTALRLAGSWSPALPLHGQLRQAGRRALRDPVGSTLLVCAIGVAVTLVWMFLPMVLLVGGLLALAVLSVEWRYAVHRVAGGGGSR